jgi:hypothetical protein
MAVYIDNYRASFGQMLMCHMIADSTDELLAMVDRIGVQRKWIQKSGTHSEHFDVCLSKKQEALAAGAIELSSKELVRRMIAKRQPREQGR